MNTSEDTNYPGKTGIWIAGALGDIAVTLMAGTLGMQKGLTGHSGLTTDLPPMNGLPLTSPDKLVFGGVDVVSRSVLESAEAVYRNSRTISRELLDSITDDLASIDRQIVIMPEILWQLPGHAEAPRTLADLTRTLRTHIRQFRECNGLDHVVVVNLTSAEPTAPHAPEKETLEGLQGLIEADRKDLLTTGILYTCAALMEGCSYLNFTSNSGPELGAVHELAARQRLPFYGNDGKTGETLVKTALAPMFACRNLQVLSWEGVNMLGNNDGSALDDPKKREAKIENKEQVLKRILGYSPHGDVAINYVPSLGDWKTAWDLIHFQGFLDVRMTMQFTWQGCDSILAAPLVLDMARLSEFASRQGESGPMHHLAAFFKNPVGVEEMAFYPQFEMLLAYAHRHLARRHPRHTVLAPVKP